MFFKNSFYIVLHGAAINFLIWTSLTFFLRLFYLSTRFLSVLTLFVKQIPDRKKNFRDQNFIDWNTVNLEPPWFPPVRLTYSHKNKLISFYRIKIFNLMRSHLTSRTSQILHFRTKYEVVFHLKEQFEKS